MNDLILNVLKFNEKVDYSIIIPFIFIYLFAFWLIVSIWVYSDSKLRYKGRRMPFLLFLLNLIFGLPFLLLYILARPFEIEEGNIDDGKEQMDRGGVNVPIVNFLGKEGVVMSLELKINSKKLADEHSSEMNIDVSFNPTDSNKVVVEKPIIKDNDNKDLVVDNRKKPVGFAGKILNIFSSRDDKKEIKPEIDITVNTSSIGLTENQQNINRKNKKKKSKKRRN